MQVLVINLDGEHITYGYAPEHYESVTAFYDELLANGEIATWWIS